MEKKITCPICFSDEQCFEEQQKDWSSYMCFNCGFTSNSMYKPDSEELKKASKGATQLMIDISFYDTDRDVTWFPSIVNMGELGIIYPEGTKNNWVYKLATPRNLTTEEKKDSKYLFNMEHRYRFWNCLARIKYFLSYSDHNNFNS